MEWYYVYCTYMYIYIFCSAVPFLQLFDFIYTFKMKPVLLKVTGSVALHRWLCVRRDESQYQWVATHSWICPPQAPPKKTNQDQTIWLAHEQKKTHQAVISSQLGIPPKRGQRGTTPIDMWLLFLRQLGELLLKVLARATQLILTCLITVGFMEDASLGNEV